MGYSIYGLQQSGRGGRTLRVMIDKETGFVSLDDCARVSQVANPILDQADLIQEAYTLEVSSPGAERALRDRGEYERFLGRTVNVLYRSGETEVVMEGRLSSVTDEGIAIQGNRNRLASVGWADIMRARLVATL
jgi:ribosome maturation factor RimP